MPDPHCTGVVVMTPSETNTPRGSEATASDSRLPDAEERAISVVQRNFRSLSQTKQEELSRSIEAGPPGSQPDVICASETGLNDPSARRHRLSGYSVYSRQRADNPQKGGVAVFVRNSSVTTHMELSRSPPDSLIEAITVKIVVNGQYYHVTSAYVPGSRAHELKEESLEGINIPGLDNTEVSHIVCGDFNVHDPAWSSLEVKLHQGEILRDWAADNGLDILNDPSTPTWRGKTVAGVSTGSPDITMVRAPDYRLWKTREDSLSDHAEISFEVGHATAIRKPPKRSFWSYDKADWASFAEAAHEALSSLSDPTIEQLEARIRKAAFRHIPRGFRQERATFWSPAMQTAADDTNRAARTVREAPPETLEAAEAALKLSKEQKEETFKLERQRLFREKLREMAGDRRAVWRYIKTKKSNARFSGSVLYDQQGTELPERKQQARAFLSLYSSVASKPDDAPRAEPVDVPDAAEYRAFTWGEWRDALRRTKKNKAVGPCNISVEMICRLSEPSQRILLASVNETLRTGQLPRSWLMGEIIPLPKPGKDPKMLKSYRPVTLTSHLCKVVERMMSRRVLYFIAHKLDPAQFGFRKYRSTADALARLLDQIVVAFNRYEEHETQYAYKGIRRYWNTKVVAILIDFSSAFDTIDHKLAIDRLESLGVPEYERRWIHQFMTERSNRVQLDGATTGWQRFTAGVPQGTVLGPLLFIIAMDSLLAGLKTIGGITSVAYADDLTITAQSTKVENTETVLQKALDYVRDWCKTSHMKVNVAKTNGQVFSYNPKATDGPEHGPITLHYGEGPDAAPIVAKRCVGDDAKEKLLGLVLHSRLNFSKHVMHLKSRALEAKGQLSLVAGPRHGYGQELLRQFAEGLCLSRLTYPLELIYHMLNEYQTGRLDETHRSILRTQAGLYRTTSRDDVFAETQAAPLELRMLERAATWRERLAVSDAEQRAFSHKQQPPVSKQKDASRAVYLTTPLTNAQQAARKAFQWAGMNYDAPRIPLAGDPVPWMDVPDNVKFFSELPQAKNKLTTEQQRLMSQEALDQHGESDIQVWSDGSSHTQLFGTGTPAPSGAAVCIITPSGATITVRRPTGIGAGTMTSELRGILMGLRELLKFLADNGIPPPRVIFATDSKSSIAHLQGGPLAASDQLVEEVWEAIFSLAPRCHQIIFQHVFSHCGLPHNEKADEAAQQAAASTQEDLPIAHRDARSAIRAYTRHLTRKWRANTAKESRSFRTKHFGSGPPPREERKWPREEQSAAARIRCDVHPLIGEPVRAYAPTMALSCRWCSKADHHESKQPKEEEIPQMARKGAVNCPICKKQISSAKELAPHYKSMHKGVPPPTAKQPLKCGHDNCTATFTNGAARKQHYKVSHNGDAPVIPRAPSTGPTETLQHCITECPALGPQRQEFSIPPLLSTPYQAYVSTNMQQITRFILAVVDGQP